MIGFGRTLRNLGSRASAPAMGKARATSLGTNSTRTSVRHTGGGSSAGLNAQSTARLQMNGTGYNKIPENRGKGPVKTYPRMNKPNSTIQPYYSRRIPNISFDSRKPKTSIGK